MNTIFTEIINIFKKECNYKKINEFNKIKHKIKKYEKGINLEDAILYRFLYGWGPN